MLSEGKVRELLGPFGLELTSRQLSQLLAYLDLLLRWNRRINLTAIRSAEGCVERHFGESLYLARWVKLEGRLLDIGSGAGFPGLALKIPFPELSVTLLEPNAKKRTFLKEVARACGMESVEVRPERLEEFASSQEAFDAASTRAVGHVERLVPLAARCLSPGGLLCVWTSKSQSVELRQLRVPISWGSPLSVPLAREREIWVGTRTATWRAT